ncbi:DUF547 domain-containing protein [Algibacter sp. Ld11]|uniref:DUF547 domain-containing protein n=1 Tax=Algibacter sp. Ld11 TaxID=649150 RepID=UPI00386D1072
MKYLIFICFSFFLLSCHTPKNITETSQEVISPVLDKKTTTSAVEQVIIKENIAAKKDTLNPEKAAVIIKESTKKPELKKNILAPHELWEQLLQKNVSASGHVNYKEFKTEQLKLKTYISTLSKIYADQSFQTLSKEELLAYWINAYNAMTVDLILKNYPIKSIKDIDKPWDQRFWKLGNKWFNLNDIEHEILRKMDEPRIHFAIVCASVSCPKLQNTAFIASNLDTQLTNATQEFLKDPERNELSENTIKISKIFQWFSKDFKKDGDIIDFINQYTNVDISAKAKKSFKDYNWNLNE